MLFPQKNNLAKLLLQKDGPSLACGCGGGPTLVVKHCGPLWSFGARRCVLQGRLCRLIGVFPLGPLHCWASRLLIRFQVREGTTDLGFKPVFTWPEGGNAEPVPWMANVFYPLNQLQLISSGCLQCCLKKASVVHPGSAGKSAGID